MARTIPWEEQPKGETRICKFYVRRCEVLQPRQAISIHSKMGKTEERADWMKTPSTLVLPKSTAPWIPNTLEEGALGKLSRLCKVPPYSMCYSFHRIGCKDTESKVIKVMPSGKKTRETQNSSGVVFPKQAFRPGPPRVDRRITEVDSSPAAELKIWKSTNEFGYNVLRYSRHHCTPVMIQ